MALSAIGRVSPKPRADSLFASAPVLLSYSEAAAEATSVLGISVFARSGSGASVATLDSFRADSGAGVAAGACAGIVVCAAMGVAAIGAAQQPAWVGPLPIHHSSSKVRRSNSAMMSTARSYHAADALEAPAFPSME